MLLFHINFIHNLTSKNLEIIKATIFLKLFHLFKILNYKFFNYFKYFMNKNFEFYFDLLDQFEFFKQKN